MCPLNRREFLYTGVAVSAAVAFVHHLPAMPSESARQPGNPVWQALYTAPSLPQFGEGSNFVNWREQGLNFGQSAVPRRQFLR